MRRYCILFFLILFATPAWSAETYYLDRDAASSGNGSSGSPWKYYSDITGLVAGDIVYISPSATAYDVSTTTMTPYGGNNTQAITYKINPTAGSGETATFTGGNPFVGKGGVVVSGDAGDGERHFVFSGGNAPVHVEYTSHNNGRNIEVGYVDMGTRERGLYMRWTYSTPDLTTPANFNIHHNYLRKTNNGGSRDYDTCAYIDVKIGVWGARGENEIHHNDFWVALHPTIYGYGDDGMKVGGQSVDIYNNSIRGFYSATYTGVQHTDGIQSLVSAYFRIYNNYFSDINNYSIFMEAYYGHHQYFEIYNNILALTISHVYNQTTPVGIVTSAKQLSYDVKNGNIFNNTFVDYGSKQSIRLADATGNGTYVNVGVYNNATVNSGGIALAYNEPNLSDSANNVAITAANAPSTFSSYTTYSASNNFNLKSTDPSFKDKGCSGSCGTNTENLTTVTTTDKDGNTRDTYWDIGAYEYVSGSADTTSPSITITSHVDPHDNGDLTTITLLGTASDNVGVTQVTWSTNLGDSGTATGTTSWTALNIPIYIGSNAITVRAHDAAGNTSTDTILVTRNAPEADGVLVKISGGSGVSVGSGVLVNIKPNTQ